MRSSIAVVLVALSVFAGAIVHGGDAENKLLLSQAIDEALKTMRRFTCSK